MPAPSHTATPEALARLAVHGLNELPEAAPVSPLSLFFTQFSSLIIWVLIGAAIISGLLQEWIDTAAILAIVLLNAGISTHTVTALLSILLMAVGLMGSFYRGEKRFFLIEPDSLLMILGYVVGMWLLFPIAG